MIIRQLKNRIIEQAFVLKGTEFDTSGISLSEPKNRDFGDLATNAAMVLAPILKQNPMQIAQRLIDSCFSKWDEAEDASIAKPGFINIDLKDAFIKSELEKIARKGKSYGLNDTGRGIKINSEYVSANPTGDLHIGHGRWAVLGDTLSRIYRANGYVLTAEYYVNDYGSQIKKFTDCVKTMYLEKLGVGCDYPGDGYPEETARKVAEVMFGDEKTRDEFSSAEEIEERIDAFSRIAVDVMLDDIKSDLCSLGVGFDIWFAESKLYKDGNFRKVMKELSSKGLVYKKDGAQWFASSRFGDDKDRVVIRKDGEPTYFASDIMYLMDKKKRDYDKFIYILGADHHGYVKRLKAIGHAIGIEDKDLKIIIGQLVRLVRSGKAVKMSKRKGQVYSLGDLVEEVGKDPVRYFFSMNSFDTPMDFDIDLAKERSNKNPVYYVQYAHARIESIIQNVKSQGFKYPDINKIDMASLDFGGGPAREIAKTLVLYPDVVNDSCENDSPHYLTQYIYGIASQFHHFYNHYRIIDGGDLKTDRFNLVLLVKIVLKNALSILGIDAPKKM